MSCSWGKFSNQVGDFYHDSVCCLHRNALLSSDACGMRYYVLDRWRDGWRKSKGKEIHCEFDRWTHTSLLCIGDTVSCCSLGVFIVYFLLSSWFLSLLRGIFDFSPIINGVCVLFSHLEFMRDLLYRKFSLNFQSKRFLSIVRNHKCRKYEIPDFARIINKKRIGLSLSLLMSGNGKILNPSPLDGCLKGGVDVCIMALVEKNLFHWNT